MSRIPNFSSHRTLVIVAALLLLLPLLAACGDDDDDAENGAETVATATEQEMVDSTATTETADATPTEAESDDGATATEQPQPDMTATPASEQATSTSSGSAGGETQDVSLALDWFPWAQHSGIYLSQERGYFADEGLNVDIHVPANPEDGLRLVGSGEEDFAISYQADVLLARAQGLPVQSVAALVQHPLNGIMSLGPAGIERPADLAGKKVGYAGLPSDEALLKSVLEADGLTLEDVEMVNVGFSLAPALVSGQVDAVIGAYFVYESFQIENETGDEVNVLPLTEWGVPDYYELVLVASDETVENEPEMVEEFVRALQQGYTDAASEREAAVEALLANNPDAVEEVETASIELLWPLWTNEGEVAFGTQTAENWERYATWLKDNGLLEDDVDASEAFTNEFVEGAAE